MKGRLLILLALMSMALPSYAQAVPEPLARANDSLVRYILKNTEKCRLSNDPDSGPDYQCEVYSRMQLDLARTARRVARDSVAKDPLVLSESILRLSHSRRKHTEEDLIVANRISGVEPDNRLFSQFTGVAYLKTNFYDRYIDIFGIQFPSPYRNSGRSFYNYFVLDTVFTKSSGHYILFFTPKDIRVCPVFEGYMYVDAKDFGLEKIHAKMAPNSNVNWVSGFQVDLMYERRDPGGWFYKRGTITVDGSVESGGAVFIPGISCTREMVWTLPEYSRQDDVKRGDSPASVLKGSGSFDDAWWEKNRMLPLSEEQRSLYEKVDSVKATTGAGVAKGLGLALATGYIDLGKVGFGPVLQMLSFNDLERVRLKFGMHTTPSFSKKDRLTGFVAYGFEDRQVKGGLTYEHMFDIEPFTKLTFDGRYDVFQIGQGSSGFTFGNLLSSFWHGDEKLAPRSSFSVRLDKEIRPSFNIVADLSMNRYYSNSFVPMCDWSGNPYSSVATNEAHLGMRFSWKETVTRRAFKKKYVYTDRPVISVDLTGSVPGIRHDDYGFFMPELTLQWKASIAPIGVSDISIKAGTIIGQVPWPLLHHYSGNVSWIGDRSAFSCLDFFEYASDSWATVMLYHDFKGLLLGLIPGVNRLKLREEFLFRMAYGVIREENNGALGHYGARMPFPAGMSSLSGPYMEIGAGISNIFRILNVDFIWRLTGREQASRPFVVNVGMKLDF